MKILYAEESDIQDLEVIGKKSFYKMGLDELGSNYDSSSFMENAKNYIENDNFIVLKAVENNKIIGGLFAYFLPELYSNNHTILQEFSMQSNPELSKQKQSQIIIKLIKYLEELSIKLESDKIGISFMPRFDLSKYLIKKGYKKSDVIYVRRVI